MRPTSLSSGSPLFPCETERGPAVARGKAENEAAGTCPDDGAASDECCQDVGNVVLLEHVNLEVPNLEVARLFYGEGLGLAADPSTSGAQRGGTHVVWYNCGRQQFHIAKGARPQRLPPGAVVGLVLPDVRAVAERLETMRKEVSATHSDVSVTCVDDDEVKVVDPYGNTFVVHSSLPYFPGRQGIAYLRLPCFIGTAAAIADFYASRMGARARVTSAHGPNGPGRRAAEAGALTTGGTAGGGEQARQSGSVQAESSGSDAQVVAEVWLGPGQKLVFQEETQLGPLSEQAAAALFDGWHIAMYVANFSRTYRAVHYPDVPPFNDHPYRDHYHSLHDALQNRQFRFQDITVYGNTPAAVGAQGPDPDPHAALANLNLASSERPPQEPSAGTPDPQDTGTDRGDMVTSGQAESTDRGEGKGRPRLVYRISHEVRSMHHPLYGRPLYNRETGFA